MDLLTTFYKIVQSEEYIVQGEEINVMHSMFTGVKNKEKLFWAETHGATSTTGH